MKEDFLHYVWQYKKFDFSNLTTVAGDELTILNSGQYLRQSGPDFFNAQIIIGNQKWAGNVEIHLKSSDWYLHQHENDPHYDNVILHVVWEHDTPIFRKDNSEIPTLALKSYVDDHILKQYLSLATPKSWIYCESQIEAVEAFVFKNWQERLFFERLERKAIPIEELLQETDNDWEAVLFYMLAKNFGLNTNGEIFLKMAKSIPFSIIRKESFEVENLEALLFGKLDLLPMDAEDFYGKDLQNRSTYITQKYRLKKTFIEPVQFFKHRPDNFPTIRLAQLAMLYHKRQNLFSKIVTTHSLADFYKLFDVGVSSYWETHYQFEKESPKKKKQCTKSFIDLLVINTIVPFQFAYAKSQGKEISESLLQLMETIAPEKNIIIEKFSNFGIHSKSAFESQSLLQLKNNYCNHGKCLQCALGIQLLKQ
ncbi:DUF2851 family protein [Flavobacterium sp. J49]|uniref:DUF2851 family protein n=1 Tax=Flavobacterium sp. J49 TaxID=2718534 RepID=UPI001593C784|nr:DUF2851 family protein [Flavobacterium sp. J49]MBF6640472.1 DUF2851 family protein [Flavobacterium sp. J49]NIC01719.1 DUF2851 family protein [Flavobacterium sp. J49]